MKWEVIETETTFTSDGGIQTVLTNRGKFETEVEADELVNQLTESEERYKNSKQYSTFKKRKIRK